MKAWEGDIQEPNQDEWNGIANVLGTSKVESENPNMGVACWEFISADRGKALVPARLGVVLDWVGDFDPRKGG